MDENYEWDAADYCSQPGDHDGEDFFLFLLITCSLIFFLLVKTLLKKPRYH